MTASISFYNGFKEYCADATIDLDNDTFKLSLHTSSYTFSATHDDLAATSDQLSTASGYTSGGATLASVTWGQTSGTATFDAADVSWTASSGSLVFRRGVIYSDTSTTDKLVLSVLFDTTPADITVADGNTFTVQWHASGIFTLA